MCAGRKKMADNILRGNCKNLGSVLFLAYNNNYWYKGIMLVKVIKFLLQPGYKLRILHNF